MSVRAGKKRRVGSNLNRSLWWFLLVVLLAAPAAPAQEAARKAPPETRRDNVTEVLHDVEVVDPYRWLENQESLETRAWIDAQNEYTQSILSTLPGRERLKKRLAALMKTDAIGLPYGRRGRYFFTKRRADADLSVIYTRKGLEGEDEALIDPHPMSPDHTTSVTLLDISRDGVLLAYGVRQGGEDEFEVRLHSVDARADLPDRLPKARILGVSLRPDKHGFYYTRFGAEGPRVYYHKIGTDSAFDAEIFGSGYGPGKIIVSELSEDGRTLLITVAHGSAADKTEIYTLDVAGNDPAVPIVNDIDARFEGSLGGDTLFLLTNWEAPHRRILAVDLENPAREAWREVVPETIAAIQGFSLAGGKLFVNYLENVRSRVAVFTPAGEHVRDIRFPTLGTVSGVRGRWGSGEAFFAFNSFHVPRTIYRTNTDEASQEVWEQVQVPVDSDELVVKQVWYESKDETRVPMFLVHARGTQLHGANPVLLTGYGGFNLSRTPRFSATAVAWAERGGVYAVANLRGGAEFGEEWHRAGMLGNKQNVFDDFIAAAEWLIANGYTNPSRLAIAGGSNGGLLVGAALTQRPDLFRAVACFYPLLDMVRYHKFLVARFWVPEYGSSDDPEQFPYLHAYSPYHRVEAGTEYPAVLFITGDSDTRVAPLHARKMAALMQAAQRSDRPVLLHYDTKAGHSGGLPVSKQIENSTDWLSFLFWELGILGGAAAR